jgi:hypothetical protein
VKPRPLVRRGNTGWQVLRIHGDGKTSAGMTFRVFRTWEAALAYANEIAGLRATQREWHRGEVRESATGSWLNGKRRRDEE